MIRLWRQSDGDAVREVRRWITVTPIKREQEQLLSVTP